MSTLQETRDAVKKGLEPVNTETKEEEIKVEKKEVAQSEEKKEEAKAKLDQTIIEELKEIKNEKVDEEITEKLSHNEKNDSVFEKEVKELKHEIKNINKELEAAKAVIKQSVDHDLSFLDNEDKELLAEFCSKDDPISTYRALTILKKHNKIGTGTEPKIARVSVDKTRVAASAEPRPRPKGIAETRRNVIEQFRKLAK